MAERIYKGKHPTILAARGALANCLWSLGGDEEALELFESALNMSRELYPDQDHRDTARMMSNLSVCHQGFGNLERALPYARDAAAMRKRLYGGDHTVVALTLQNFAYLLAETDHREHTALVAAEAEEQGHPRPPPWVISFSVRSTSRAIRIRSTSRTSPGDSLSRAEHIIAVIAVLFLLTGALGLPLLYHSRAFTTTGKWIVGIATTAITIAACYLGYLEAMRTYRIISDVMNIL